MAQDVFASCAIGFALKKVKVSVNVKVELLFICIFAADFLKTMKKIFLLLALLFANMAVEAQIQRSFLGLELGVSTRQQVEETLRGMGKEFTPGASRIMAHDMELDDYEWANVRFGFKGDKLVLLLMTSRTYELRDKFTAEADAAQMKSRMEDKYRSYQYQFINNGKIVGYYDEVTMAAFFETPKTLQFGIAYADGDSYMSLLQQFR